MTIRLKFVLESPHILRVIIAIRRTNMNRKHTPSISLHSEWPSKRAATVYSDQCRLAHGAHVEELPSRPPGKRLKKARGKLRPTEVECRDLRPPIAPGTLCKGRCSNSR